ncbi:MAG: Fur family transcriptional regulator [Alphaproteobacteria bacterium]|jgi:Fur family zinc uptake transcriptional regulator|nr:Fur family transcriptional regulator [Alphaproteobacteria bacterium]
MASKRSTADPFAPHGHDHDACVQTALAAAATSCARDGKRLTPLRRRVLELVWRSHRPVGAYDLLALLQVERGRVAPPTVYRALEFLRHQGLVHRLDSLNAFIGCDRPGHGHQGHFLICQQCGAAVEVRDGNLSGAIDRLADRSGFAIAAETVELTGHCAGCRD